jgi:hypothetical protein
MHGRPHVARSYAASLQRPSAASQFVVVLSSLLYLADATRHNFEWPQALTTGPLNSGTAQRRAQATVPSFSNNSGTWTLDDNGASHRWSTWLAAERYAHRWRRTRQELAAFDASCGGTLQKDWVARHSAHEELASIVVVDGRHEWPGLGTAFDFYNARQLLGSALGRATFQLLCPCSASPSTPPHPADAHNATRAARCRADPAAHVHAFDGWSWRWDAAAEERMQAAAVTRGEARLQEKAVNYICLRRTPDGCVHSQLVDGAALLMNATGRPDAVAASTLATLRSLHAHRWLRLVPQVHEDLNDVTRFEVSRPSDGPCASQGGNMTQCSPAVDALRKCEAFALWRPTRTMWNYLQPLLQKMDGWRSIVALGMRTGVADHVAAFPSALAVQSHRFKGHNAWLGQLSLLLSPCAQETPSGFGGARNVSLNPQPCVHWAQGRDRWLGNDSARRVVAECTGQEPDAGVKSRSEVPGILGAFFDCAANTAANLAASDAIAHPGEHGPRLHSVDAGRYNSSAFGVLLFSDAPALRCALEASRLNADGHVGMTPTFPGHVSYAPPGRAAGTLVTAVTRAAVSDLYALGLADVLLRATGSVFYNAARKRASLPELPIARAPPIGREHWFSAGREHLRGSTGVQADLLDLLCSTPLKECPVVAADVAAAREEYLSSPQWDPL